MGSVVVIFYGSGLFFAIMVLLKLIKYYRTPPHLRWEIYKDSSIYEKVNWWDHEHTGFLHKLKTIVLDILFQREYFRRNRSFWYVLIVFHVGLYLLILWHAWLFIAALVINVDAAPTWGMVWGHIATATIVLGALGILIMRLTNEEMRAFYPRTHFFKWIFIIATLGGGFYATQFFYDGSIIDVVRHVNEELDFSKFADKFHPETIPSLHLFLVAAWLIYLPFSHIMNVIFRFYHEIRWDHVPMTKGSALEKNISPLLGRKVSWADSHIQTGKTWGEVASGMPEDKPQ